ncbi:protein of unknown function [uncultured Woeseiaceae bacterium]|uniref:Uncharacterized protein n=1 Tax=uncultured Woeseiaceae bacterium TaxID=1983305 RepID=A0A7D9D289_9GAMM|nr:protein of unknown function [uncultured Woeseiaceae bacterium]
MTNNRSYRTGEVQELADGFLGQITIRTNFRGLVDSIRLHEIAAGKWQAILAMPLDPAISAKMETDSVWFKGMSSRYRPMTATTAFAIARFGQSDSAESRTRMTTRMQLLESSAITQDAISPADQRALWPCTARWRVYSRWPRPG